MILPLQKEFIMTSEDFQKLKEFANKDLKFTDDNVSKKILDQPYQFHRYLDIYLTEKKELDRLERQKKMIFAKKYHFYKFDYDHKLETQKEIECYINGDSDYDKICLEFNQQEIQVLYLVELLDLLKKQSFSMGNYIKLKIFLAGGNT